MQPSVRWYWVPDQTEVSIDVRDAIEKLPPNLREVALRRMEQTEAEIGRAMGLSRGKVRACLARIRRHFEVCKIDKGWLVT